MADVLTFTFRTFMSKIVTEKQYEVIPPSPKTCCTLLVGDNGLSRSVLLLSAVTAVSDMGMKVMFFSQTQIQKLPASLHRFPKNRNPDSLKKITFSYPRTLQELLQQVASLHEPANTSPTAPSLIIVDRIEGYLHSTGESSNAGVLSLEPSRAAHVAALLCDTAAFLTQALEQRAPSLTPCRIIASYQTGGEPSASDPILNVLDRYFQVCCTLHHDGSNGAVAAGPQEGIWRVTFSGAGIREALGTVTDEDQHSEVAQEWELLISSDGLIEFNVV